MSFHTRLCCRKKSHEPNPRSGNIVIVDLVKCPLVSKLGEHGRKLDTPTELHSADNAVDKLVKLEQWNMSR